jgi:hypothetical protein
VTDHKVTVAAERDQVGGIKLISAGMDREEVVNLQVLGPATGLAFAFAGEMLTPDSRPLAGSDESNYMVPEGGNQSSSRSSKRNHHGLSSIEQGADEVAFLLLLSHLDTHAG